MNLATKKNLSLEPPQEQFRAIIALWGEGNLRVALSESKVLLKEFPNSIPLLNFIGICHTKLENFEAAIETFNTIISINPYDTNTHFNIANTYKDVGKNDQAIAGYKKVLKINPTDSDAFNNLGVCWYNKGEFDNAVESYQNAININPYFAIAYNNMARALERKGNLDLAIEKYQQALSINADDYDVYNNLGLALKKKGIFDSAIENYKEALKINPQFSTAYVNLGTVLAEQKRFSAAIENYKQALKITPNDGDIHNSIGLAFKLSGNIDAAIASFEHALKLKPSTAKICFNLGICYMLKGSLNDAIKYYREAIAIDPGFVDAHHNMGVTFQHQGELDKALGSFKKALDLSPYTTRSRVYFEQARHLQAASNGNKTSSAPQAYVENLFDKYAGAFEEILVKELKYCAPKMIVDVIKSDLPNGSLGSVLDLGCGTGLVGMQFDNLCSSILGIDVSKAMLDQARRKNVYHKLIQVDLRKYLSTEKLDFDYFVASDVFIYVGELSELFQLIKFRNQRSGKLVFSTEHTEKDGFFLEKSGRYTHSRSYIESLSKDFGYKLVHFSTFDLRKENGKYLAGGLYLLDF